MTATLLKHEWLRTRGMLGAAFGLILLVGITGSLLGAAGWFLAMFGLVVGALAAGVMLPAIQLVLAVDYWRNGYGRTGYFTQSIPVRGSTIFWVKILWTLLVSIVALVFSVLLGWLVWWAIAVRFDYALPSLSMIGDAIGAAFEVAPAWMIVAGVLGLLFSLVATSVNYYFSVSIGHERWLSSLGSGGPIVVFVVLYLVSQFVTFLGMLLVPLGIGMQDDRLAVVSFNVISELSVGTNTSEVMPIGFLVTMTLLALILLWRTAVSWNRKVALR